MNYERRGYFFLDAKFNANFIEVCIQKFGACKTIGDCQRRNHERGNGYLVFILEFIFHYFLDILNWRNRITNMITFLILFSPLKNIAE